MNQEHITPDASELVLARIADLLETRLPSRGGDPTASYVAKLFSKGPDAALKKVGEEADPVFSERPVVGLRPEF